LDDRELAHLYRHLDDRVYEGESHGRRLTALRHYEIMRRYVERGRVLDVGCASGLFLQTCAQNGWDTVGIEPAKGLSAKAKSVLGERAEVICSTLQEASLAPDSFDVVTLWDVLEHVPEPVEFLQSCVSLVKPGGFVFANVPDLDSVQARILHRQWPLLLPEHFNYFNRSSLERCGKKAGVKLRKFGRRPTHFSTGYIFYRLGQHRIPGTQIVAKLLRTTRADQILIPVYLGETYCVWER
jgi:SAM-dependent methyltransferase